MSNQAHMEPRKDAANKRFDYLVDLFQVKFSGCVGLCISGFAILGAVICLVGLHTSSWTYFEINVPELSIPGLCICVASALGGWAISKSSIKEASAMPYVPPVSEQVAALSDEDILVRGSDQPTAPSGELLRAARKGTETDDAELLRAEMRSP